MSESRLRIAWFTDISVGRSESLSTYCSRLLVPELSKRHAIEVFSDEANLVSSGEVFGTPLSHYLNAYKRHRESPFDLFLYQLEDSRACRFIRGHIGLVPGIVWVHDLFCNDLGPEACHTSPWERTIRQFIDPRVEFADRAKAPHQLWPRAFRETSLCPVVLFSSSWARNEFKRMISNRLEAIDGTHYAAVLPVPGADTDLQESPPSKVFRIATVSVPGIEGRAHKVLPVLRSLTGEWHLTWLVDEAQREGARSLCNEFGIPESCASLVSPRSIEAWCDIVSVSDIALHLHTSPFGHLAPFIQSSLAAGCPVITARSAQGEDFPDDVVFHITPGIHEASELRGIVNELQSSTTMRRREYGAAGVAYVRENFDRTSVATTLSNILIEAAPHVSHVMDRWQRIGQRAQKALLEEVRGLVSLKTDTVPSAYDLVLTPALRNLGWL
jgi:hypothetical protein